ncbi:SNF1 protein kinase subunit beta-3 [Wickerhamiella sorbophila]|uniref:SNF1 protein kinase subunit beta-3 n=1 Tax=Wickerhamiella sorbophila TaxID=45607 RepID=A0A2T0FPG6_9ASCO|nr:SNF1 protein kinase subunit beta-3 [Wickerhamiella sorbophila]PRT56875.1 SNF1 protein kinase subunit beta-3 [Wickerhamiella sorbophila]
MGNSSSQDTMLHEGEGGEYNAPESPAPINIEGSNPPGISPPVSPRVQPFLEGEDPDHRGMPADANSSGLPVLKPLTSEEGSSPRPRARRRSTLMLEGEDEDINMRDAAADPDGPMSRAASGDQLELERMPAQNTGSEGLVETVIEWKQGGNDVYVTGSFTGWRQMIPLHQNEPGKFTVVLKLAPGTHRLRFVVDGELRTSDYMYTATDSMGNLLNYMEVQPRNGLEYWAVEEEEEVPEEELEYVQVIPEIFANIEALDRLSSQDFTTPPQLPPHLDGVILNANWNEKDNNSVLPIPNHVILNHLATTSIRHNVLAVASVSRYSSKYVTQILYTPL